MKDDYVSLDRVRLKGHPKYDEKAVQDLIAESPSILGLGDLELRARERSQPRAGRLDLLLADVGSQTRYVVELQLGAVDESHIVRTIEYWDIERKRYPQYEHVAVLVAENVTSRFLNVMSLLNGTIPLVVIQMQALSLGDERITIVFTTVMDVLRRGPVDEDEETQAAKTDRAYWEKKATAGTVALADDVLKGVRQLDGQLGTLELRYTKYYIGLEKGSAAYNFVKFRPNKQALNLELRLTQTDEVNALIEEAGLETLDYDGRQGLYKIRLTKQQVNSKMSVLEDLSRRAYDERRGAD